jgi:hypothetical protein
MPWYKPHPRKDRAGGVAHSAGGEMVCNNSPSSSFGTVKEYVESGEDGSCTAG